MKEKSVIFAVAILLLVVSAASIIYTYYAVSGLSAELRSLRSTLDLLTGVVAPEGVEYAEMVAAANEEGIVVFYSATRITELTKWAETFNNKYPSITVQVVRASSVKTTERYRTEAAAGKYICDVIQISGTPTFESFKEDGLVTNYTSPKHEFYPDAYKDPGLWAVAQGRGIGIIYNTDLVESEDAPTSWNALIDPKWKDDVVICAPEAGATAFLSYYFQVKRTMAEGKLYEHWGEALIENGVVCTAGHADLTARVAAGEFAMGTCTWPHAEAVIAAGAPCNWIVPEEGTVTNVYPIGIAKNPPHPNAAKVFVDWVLSKEAQIYFVTELCYDSFRTDLQPELIRPEFFTYTVHDVDWEEVDSVFDDWSTDFKSWYAE